MKMNKKQAEWIVFSLVVAIVVFLGLNTQRFFTRIDLTATRQHSISRVSRELFREIPEQVYLTYYVSDKLQRMYGFPGQVEDLLREYAAYSRGRITVAVRDPAVSGETGMIEQMGVYPQQIEVIEQNERSVARVYTGIVIQYLDRTKVIPVVTQLDTLEYDLTSRIRQVVDDQERTVGMLIGTPGLELSANFQGLTSELSADFDLLPVEKGRDIPQEIDVLFVIGNQDLDRFDLFPIDQYLMRGGRVLFAVEGVRMDLMRGLSAEPMTDNPLLDMLSHYGVEVGRELLLDKYNKNFRQPRMILGQVMWQLMDKYPHWVTIAGQFASRDNPITARFSGLDLYWPSPLELVEREGVQGDMIIRSTPDAWVMKENFQMMPDQAAMLAYTPQEGSGQRGLAAVLTGRFKTFFEEIPTRAGENRDWKEIAASSPETRIMVVGDSDFASDFFQYTDASYNLQFLINSAEWLTNGEDLLSIRTRVAQDLRLNRIRDPQVMLRAALFTQLLNVILIPLAVIGFGLIRFFLRRKRRTAAAVEG